MRRLVSIVFVAATLCALVAAPARAEDVYSPETLRIARELQCPVCAGQSVADSNSELARQMRAIIEEKVRAGESEEQIRAYFVERYGPGILADPPKSGFTLTLWWVPVVGLAIGAIVLGLFLRERTRVRHPLSPPGATRADDDELERIAREVLGPDARSETASP